jgi:hypothetical protein
MATPPDGPAPGHEAPWCPSCGGQIRDGECGCSGPIVRTLRTLRAEPVWERCTGPCGREYAYPHLCREHMLCGLCHPPVGD